ncbi:hypothetical protein ABPG74_001420 [Tetrahymena malaccensis]
MDYFQYQEQDLIKQEFKIQCKIAEGAFGSVFKAIKQNTQQIVAIKDLFFNQNKRSKQIVEREVSILQDLNDHPNIVKLIDYQISNNKCSLMMEYVDYDLKQFIESQVYPLSHTKIKRIAYQLLTGLSYIHQKGIIHRDLKPSNILITDQFIVKIGDFGSAIKEESRKDRQFSIEGFTRWYKSPEQLFGSREYNYEIDIWSFACIYAEIIQGYPLFSGNNEIEQIAKISDLLGNPCEENWPSIVNMPDYGKILFKQKQKKNLSSIFSQASEKEIEFLNSMLKYDNRPTADQLLQSDYFKDGSVPLKLGNKSLILPPKQEDKIYFNYTNLLKK